MDPFNLKTLRISGSSIRKSLDKKKPPQHKPGEKFLKGPIPWNWLSKAAKQPGKALHAAIVIWFIAGINNNREIKFSYKALGIERLATYRGLAALEEAGLISLVKKDGCCPIVTINDFESHET